MLFFGVPEDCAARASNPIPTANIRHRMQKSRIFMASVLPFLSKDALLRTGSIYLDECFHESLPQTWLAITVGAVRGFQTNV